MIIFFHKNKIRILCTMLLSSIIFFNAVNSVSAAPCSPPPCLDNPLPTDDPRVFIGQIIKAILGLSGSVALLIFIYGGLVYLTAQGENERIQRAKNTLTWATVGLAVIFGSYAFLTYLFKGLIGQV